MFGVANALFSGLAFGGIIFTIYLQREDLKSTRVELKEAREEFRIQQFEANLFNLINSHLKIVEQLSVKGNSGIYSKGREVFRIIYESKKKDTKKIIFDEQDDVNHYFRNIYRILKFIKRESFKGTEEEVSKAKYVYSNLLRSLLSTYELKSILFWSIQKDGEELIEYINLFTLLRDISEDLKDPTLHPKLEKSAFEIPERYKNNLETT
jgi:hypothetical protein